MQNRLLSIQNWRALCARKSILHAQKQVHTNFDIIKVCFYKTTSYIATECTTPEKLKVKCVQAKP